METFFSRAGSTDSAPADPAATPPVRRRVGLRFGAPLALLFLALSLLAGAAAGAGPSRRPVPHFAGGIMVNEPDHDRWVRALDAAGLNSVQVTVYARQGRWDSADLEFPREVPAVVSEIRAAKAAGLRVVLVLRTYLEHALPENRHLWHGMIWPRPELVDDWFDRYGAYVRWGARFARQHDVDLLAVGNELNSMTSTTSVDRVPDPYAYYLDASRTGRVRRRLVACARRVPERRIDPDLSYTDGTRFDDLEALLRDEERARRHWSARVLGVDPSAARRAAATGRDPSELADLERFRARRRRHDRAWREIVEAARSLFPGPVTYGANFDQVADIGFWNALDSIGVNTYFKLGLYGLSGSSLRDRIARRWRQIADRLAAIGGRAAPGAGLPVTFLEMGWTRKEGATVRPYSYRRVEVLETASSGGFPELGAPTLTCVHWGSQPEAPAERIAALEGLLEVVEAGGFPELRGFSLWKLSTLPRHRAIEPFVVVLPPPTTGDGRGSAASGPNGSGPSAADTHDRRFLEVARRLARAIREAPVSEWSRDGGGPTARRRR